MRKLVALLLCLLAGCGGSTVAEEPRLDCSSKEAYSDSLTKIKASMSTSEKKELELNFAMYCTLPTEREAADGEGPIYLTAYRAAKPFDGMTGKEIIAKCKELVERADGERLRKYNESKGEPTP